MTDMPDEHAPGTDVSCDGEEIDIGLKLAGLPGEILVQLAEMLVQLCMCMYVAVGMGMHMWRWAWTCTRRCTRR